MTLIALALWRTGPPPAGCRRTQGLAPWGHGAACPGAGTGAPPGLCPGQLQDEAALVARGSLCCPAPAQHTVPPWGPVCHTGLNGWGGREGADPWCYLGGTRGCVLLAAFRRKLCLRQSCPGCPMRNPALQLQVPADGIRRGCRAWRGRGDGREPAGAGLSAGQGELSSLQEPGAEPRPERSGLDQGFDPNQRPPGLNAPA